MILEKVKVALNNLRPEPLEEVSYLCQTTALTLNIETGLTRGRDLLVRTILVPCLEALHAEYYVQRN